MPDTWTTPRSVTARALVVLLLAATILVVVPPGARATPSAFRFTGAGWGHAIGLPQYGAKGQAEAGRSYQTILAYYYQGTRVEHRDPPPFVRIMLATDLGEFQVEGNDHYEFHVNGSPVTASGGNDGLWRVRVDAERRFSVFRPDGSKAAGPVGSASQPLVVGFEPWNTIVRLPQTGHRYRWGHIELNALGDGKIRVIAVLSLEAYLRGLGEMPNSWHMEALRAQAIAGRTYAAEKAFRLGHNRSGCNCTLFGDTRDQAYIGYDKEDPATYGGSASMAVRWPDAVTSTANQVVTYNASGTWRHAMTFYSSSSGGRTEDNDDVWGGSPISYLRSVDDPWSQTSGNPYASWEITYRQGDVASRLGMGRVDRIDLGARTTGGGVAEAKVFGDVNKTFSGDRFRSLLGLRSIKVNVEETTLPGVWSGWSQVGSQQIEATEDPSLASAPNSAIHATIIGADGRPYTSRRDPGNGAWSGWSRIGPPHSAGFFPDMAGTPDAKMHTVIRGRGYANIYAAWRDPSTGAWHAWTRIGASHTRGHVPKVAAGPDGAVWTVIRGFDDAAWVARRDPGSGAWSGWTKIGNDAFEPDIAVTGNEVYVVARQANGHIKVAKHDGRGWGPFVRMGSGGDAGTQPAIVTRPDGSLVVVVRGQHGHQFFSRSSAFGWTPWSRIGSAHDRAGDGAGPQLAADPSGAVHVLVRGRNDGIYTSMQPSPASGWSNWTRVGHSHDVVGPNGGTPATAAQNGLVHALIRGGNQHVYTSYRVP